MGSGQVGRRTPWQSVQRVRGRLRRSSCSLRRRSASSDTGSKIFTTLYRSIWVAPFTTSVCQWPMLSDVPGLNRSG